MNKWLFRLAQATGLLLLLLTLTSALWPATPVGKEKTALALRQIGHNYLTVTCDVSSRIPAVEKTKDGTLLLRLERSISYDTLNQIARAVFADYGIQSDYTLTLEDCGSGDVFLGSLWPGVIPNEPELPEGACLGRDQETRCANIGFSLAEDQRAAPTTLTWLLGGLGVLLLLAGRFTPSPPVVAEPANLVILSPAETTIQLCAGCTFNESSHLLTVGDREYELTYREAKLFAYFANRPNAILERADINEAVWGEEGIITGRSLDVFVSRLRKKIAGTEALEIKTVHGIGYRLAVA